MITVDGSKARRRHLRDVIKFAREVGKYGNKNDPGDLKRNLEYLRNYAGKGNTLCLLKPDGAPMSFTFVMFKKVERGDVVTPHGEFKYWFNGGLLFHGRHDGFGSGSGPTFAVTLNPTDGWSIHT